MIPLPNECYYQIFNNFQHDYKRLFSCALVNRQWCRIIIPILWNEPEKHFKDIRFISTLLLMLNTEERAILIPFNIIFPSHPKPLFEYTNYITSINNDLDDGIENWLCYKTCARQREFENAIKYSLTAMLLRTSKNLKNLCINKIICTQIISENLYENTTITSIFLYDINGNFITNVINVLAKILYKSTTLTSLRLKSSLLKNREFKTLLEALDKNTVLRSLDLLNNQIDFEERKEEKH
ncbi:f-box domain-containing protein [Gigaspora margarita]|uniref:F-box domain-containing protein n=1 Tax=Gigaspora margarita TaxID=4874 RepID=A0A8H4B5A1_GIGMA|nr:f-box domain-containing protein [Gigaspora margarita]